MTDIQKLYAGLDAGGTTFKCALSDAQGKILTRQRFETTTPEQTISSCASFFLGEAQRLSGDIAALGIATFGPVDVDPASKGYGSILKTPKQHWTNAPLRRRFVETLSVPVNVDTDVNGALLAEMASGAASNSSSAAYVTVGTGIGAGVSVHRTLVGKPSHPEFGHIPIRRNEADEYPGFCRFHGDCLEGLASATAFTKRFGRPEDLPEDHLGWQILADYLGQACWSLFATFRVEKILLGGGLMLAPHLLALVKSEFVKLSGGYLDLSEQDAERLICRPFHGDDAGLQGGLLLARLAIKKPTT